MKPIHSLFLLLVGIAPALAAATTPEPPYGYIRVVGARGAGQPENFSVCPSIENWGATQLGKSCVQARLGDFLRLDPGTYDVWYSGSRLPAIGVKIYDRSTFELSRVLTGADAPTFHVAVDYRDPAMQMNLLGSIDGSLCSSKKNFAPEARNACQALTEAYQQHSIAPLIGTMIRINDDGGASLAQLYQHDAFLSHTIELSWSKPNEAINQQSAAPDFVSLFPGSYRIVYSSNAAKPVIVR